MMFEYLFTAILISLSTVNIIACYSAGTSTSGTDVILWPRWCIQSYPQDRAEAVALIFGTDVIPWPYWRIPSNTPSNSNTHNPKKKKKVLRKQSQNKFQNS
jgi:hypothetical protein